MSGRIARAVGAVMVAAGVAGGAWAYLSQAELQGHRDDVIDLEASIEEAPERPAVEVSASAEAGFDAEGDPWLVRRMDVASLRQANPDALCWMTIPGTAIDSYVMLEPSAGTFKYDRRDLWLNYAVCGSYTVPAAAPGPRDAHQLVLGHHMGSAGGEWQFSNLPDRYWSMGAAGEHPWLYLYYPDRSERWTCWLACQASASDEVYLTPYELGSPDYAGLLDHVRGLALWARDLDVDASVPTLVTSTCHSLASGDSGRFFVCWAPEAVHFYEGDVTVSLSDELARSRWVGAKLSWPSGFIQGA